MIADLLKRACRGIAILAFVLVMAVYPVAAGDTILSNNSGVENENFYIEGEPSLVINGFDLTPLGLNLPVALDAVSISVNTPAPGSGIDLVVYQDGNGGSPVDATLVYRQPVALARSGINRITIDPPVIITEPVVWVGFYLPVGFHFNADQSGSSVLTYWAWTPGGTFDLNALSSAAVLGPGDGTEPVNISMNGVARITAELRTPEYEETIAGLPLGQQIVDNTPQDTSILRLYPQCDALLYDPEDIAVTASNSFSLECIVADEIDAPTAISQPPNQELDLQRAGQLYKLREQIPESLRKAGAYNTLPEPVTHCFRVPPVDLERAVIGEAHGTPEKWQILPSVRFGDIVCAEVTMANYISYFLPRTESSPPNVNLVVGWSRVNPHPLQCGTDTRIVAPIVNTGQSWFETDSGHVRLSVEDIHVQTGVTTPLIIMPINTDQLGPGARLMFEIGPVYVTNYVNDLHRLKISVDINNEIEETNEFDNSWFTEYILVYPEGSDKCAEPPEDN